MPANRDSPPRGERANGELTDEHTLRREFVERQLAFISDDRLHPAQLADISKTDLQARVRESRVILEIVETVLEELGEEQNT